MIGMTPPVLTRERQVRALAAVDLPAHDSLGVGYGDPALAPLHEDDDGDDRQHQGRQDDEPQGIHGPRS